MNKIYKVIWSKTRQCYVAVSEVAKSHTKNKAKIGGVSLGKTALSLAVLLTLSGAMGFVDDFGGLYAQAATIVDGQSYFHVNWQDNPSGDDDKNWGDNGGIGTATGKNSLAGGMAAYASSENATAIGNYSVAKGKDSTAVGEDSKALGIESVAVGQNAKTAELTYGGVAIGKGADSKKSGAIAVGQDVVSGGENSIAMGKGSKAQGELKTKVYIDNELSKLKDVLGDDSELVIKEENGKKYIEVEYENDKGQKIKPNADYALAIGAGATATNDGAAAFGYQANATGKRAAAFGNNTTAVGDSSMAVGIGTATFGDSSMAVGGGSVATKKAKNSMVIGNSSIVNSAKSIAVGNKAFAGYKKEVYVVIPEDLQDKIGEITGGNNTVYVLAENGEYKNYDKNNSEHKDLEKYIKIDNTNEKSDFALAVGYYSEALNEGATAFGYESTALGKQSSALGFGTTALGEQSTALGTASIAGGDKSIAIGNEAVTYNAAEDALVIGNKAKAENKKAMALGAYSIAKGEQSTAVGPSAEAIGKSALALGDTAKAKAEGSVSIGASSNVDESNHIVENGAYSVAIGSKTQSKGVNSLAMGVDAHSDGAASVALGQLSVAKGANTVALGNTAVADGGESVSIGYLAKSATGGAVAIGSGANSTFWHSVAIGTGSQALNLGSFAGGQKSNAAGEYAVAIGGGANLNDDKAASATGLWGVALGHKSNAEGSQSTAIANGAQATAGNALAIGTDSRATAINTTAIGVGAQATNEDAVAIGAWSTTKEAVKTSQATVGSVTYSGFAGADAKSVVSIGNDEMERQIVNVAAGRMTADSTDAVNGSQLYAVANKPITFSGDNSGTTDRKLGETLKIVGDDVVSTAVTDGQIKLNIDKSKLGKTYTGGKNITIDSNNVINTNDAVQFGTSVTVGDDNKQNVKIGKDSIQFTKEIEATGGLGDSTYSPGLKISSQGIDMADTEIKNLKSVIENNEDGDYIVKLNKAKNNRETAKSAVNVSDLQQTTAAIIDKGLTFSGNSGKTGRKLGETLKIIGDDESIITTAATDGQIKLNIDKSKLGKTYTGSDNIEIGTNNVIKTKDAVHFDKSVTVGVKDVGLEVANQRQNVKIEKDLIQFRKKVGAPGGLGNDQYHDSLSISSKGIDMDNTEIKNLKSAIKDKSGTKFSDQLKAAQKDTKTAKNAVNVSDLNSIAAELEEDISTNKTNIGNNAKAIKDNKGKIETNTNAISRNTSSIKANTNAISGNTSKISTNTSNIQKNTDAIKGKLGKSDIHRITGKGITVSADGNVANNAINLSITDGAISNAKLDSALQSKIAQIETNKTAIEKNAGGIKTNKDSISALDGRVKNAEGKITQLETKTTKNEKAIADNKTKITANTKDIGDLKTKTNTIEQNVTAVTTRVDAAESNINELKTNKADISYVNTELGKKVNTGDVHKITSDGIIEVSQGDILAGEVRLSLKDGSVTGSKLAKETITSENIKNGTIRYDDLNTELQNTVDNVVKNQKNIASHTISINKNKEDITQLTNEVNTNKEHIKTNKANIKTNSDSITALNGRVTANETAIGTNTSDITKLKNLSNITTAGEKVIKYNAKKAINVKGEGLASVDKTDVNGVDTYTVTVKADANKADLNLGNISTEGVTKIKTTAQEAVKLDNGTNTTVSEVNANGNKTYKVNVTANGQIASGDTGLISGGTLYNETRANNNGNYIEAGKSAAENLKALDTQVKTNETGISSNKTAIENIGTVTTKADSGLLISSTNKALKSGDIELDLDINKVVDKFVGDTTAVKKVITKVENEAHLTYKANSDGTTRHTKLKDGLVFTNGDMTTATSGEGGVVTFDINAATKAKINSIDTIKNQADTNASSITSINDRLDGKAYGVTTGGKNAVRKIGEQLAVTSGNNIITAIDGDDENSAALKISLNNKLNLGNDGTITIGGTTLKDNELKMGNTTVTNGGITTDAVTVGGDIYINKQGINANNNVIKNVADGSNEGDAVNKKQLDEVAGKIHNVTVKSGDDNVDVTTKDGKPYEYIVTVKGNGTVAQNDNKVVTGQTMYNELRPEDGTYVKKANTTATNLKNLDTQVKANNDAISTNAGKIAANESTISTVKSNLESATYGVTVKGVDGAEDKSATRKLNEKLEVKGVDNITASIDGTEEGKAVLKLALDKDVNLTDEGTLTVGNVGIKNNEIKAGKSVITNEGITADKLTVGGKYKSVITDGKITLGEGKKTQIILDSTGEHNGKIGIGFRNDQGEFGSYITDDYARFGGVQVGHANDGNHVQGLTNKTWTIDRSHPDAKPAEFVSGRAATEDQLWIASEEFNKRLVNVSDWRLVGEKDDSVVGTDHESVVRRYQAGNAYEVKDGKIVLHVLDINPDGEHTVQDITIGDVASAKDVKNLDDFAVKYASKDDGHGKTVVDNSVINLAGVTDEHGTNIGTRITNLADGINNNDAVNVKQLKESIVNISVNGGTKAPVDSDDVPTNEYSNDGKNLLIKKHLKNDGEDGAEYDIKLNDVLNIGSDADEFKKAKMVTIDGTKAQVAVGKNTFIENNKATIGAIKIAGEEAKWVQDPNGTDFNPNRPSEKGRWVATGNKNTVTGLGNVAWNGTTDDKSRAATEGQLQSISEKGFALAAEGPDGTAADGTTPKKELHGKLGEALKVHGDGKNISTSIEGGALKIKMNESPEFKTLTVTNGVNGVVINGEDKVITGLTNNTLAEGFGENARAGQAATEAQLKIVNDVAKIHNTVVKGDNVTVDSSKRNANGGIEYKISATNMRVTKGEITYPAYTGSVQVGDAQANHSGADGNLKLTLGDGSVVNISNLKDRYTVNGNFKAGGAEYDEGGEKKKADVVTFTRNDGTTYDVVLKDLAESGSLVNTYVTKKELNTQVNAINDDMKKLGFNLSADSSKDADGPKIVDGTKVLITGEKVATGDGHGNISTTLVEENGKQVLHINQVNDPKFSYNLKDVTEEQIVEINAKYQEKVNGHIKDVEGATGGTITGLANKEWGDDYEFVSGRAATEDQLSKVLNTAKNRAEVTVNNNQKATQNPDGTFNDIIDGNLLMEKSVTEQGAPVYNVHLNDQITLGNTPDSNIKLDGLEGKAKFGKVTVGKHMDVRYVDMHAGVPNFDITTGDYVYKTGYRNIIAGLDNKDFIPGFTGNTMAMNDRSGFAATEGQLKDLWIKGFSLKTELPDPDSVIMNRPNKIISQPIGGRINISGDLFGNHNITTIANNHNNEVFIHMSDNPNFQSVTLHDFKTDEDGHILHDYRLDEDGNKIPVQKHEVIGGKWTPVVDDDGNPVYEKEADGSIKYERDQSKPLYKADRVSKFDTDGVRIKTYDINEAGEKTSGKLTSYSSDGLVIQKAVVEGGKVKVDGDGNTVYDDDIKNKIVLNEHGLSNGSQKITNLAAGSDNTDAVNVGQLKNTTFGVKADDYVATSNNIATRKADEVLDVLGDESIKTSIEGTDKGSAKLRISLGDDISVGRKAKDGETTGVDGKIAVNGKNGKQGVAISAQGEDGQETADGHIVINHVGENQADGNPVPGAAGKDAQADISIKNTTTGIDGTNGKPGDNGADGMTRIVYKDLNDTVHEVATLDDGLKFQGDEGSEVARKLGETLKLEGGMEAKAIPGEGGNNLSVKEQVTTGNIGVYEDGTTGTLKVGLAKEVNLTEEGSLTIGNTLVKDNNIVLGGTDGTAITNNDVTSKAYKVKTAGGTETYIDGSGLNANSKVIKNVANGNANTDAVNKGQLDAVKAIAEKHSTVKAKDGETNITVDDNVVDGTHHYTVSVADDGTITADAAGNKLITGKKVYDEVHVAADGTYVKSGNTVAGNLTALDNQLKTNTEAIASATFGVNVGGSETATRKNNETLKVEGDTNITTAIDGADPETAALKISLNKDLKLGTDGSVTAGTMTVGNANKVVISDNSIKLGTDGTEITKEAVKSAAYKVGTETYIDSTGLNANSKVIKNVADGVQDTDAVNMRQLNAKLDSTSAAQEIAYTANGAAPTKKVKLSKGFNFQNSGMIDASVEDDGVVKFDINATTKNKINKIETIEGVANKNKDDIAGLTPKVTANEAAINNLKPRVKANEDAITGLKDLSNITETGKGVIKTQAKKAINVVGDGKLASVEKKDVGGVDTYTVKVKADDTKADKTLGNIEDAGKKVIRDEAKKAVKVGAGTNSTVSTETDTSGNITYKVDVVANGSIANGNTGLISGGTLYNEVHVEHGNYIKAANTVAGNLSALDTQVAKNTGDIAANKGNITANTNAINKIGTVKVTGTAGLTIEGNTELKNGDVTIKLDKSTLVDDVTDTFLKIDGSNIGDDNAKNTFGSAVGVGTITSDTSTKLVQEKAVKAELDKKADADSVIAKGSLKKITSDDLDVTNGGNLETGDVKLSIKDNAITSAKIKDGAITTDKIAADNVTKDKLTEGIRTSLGKADTALQEANIHKITGDSAINVGNGGNILTGDVQLTLNDNSITTAKLVDKNVTKAKLANDVQSSLAKADSALQSVNDIESTDGSIVVTGKNVATGKVDLKIATTTLTAGTDGNVAVTDSGTKFVTGQNIADMVNSRLAKDGANIGDKAAKNTFGNNVGVGTLDDSTSLVQAKAVKDAIDGINTSVTNQKISYKANDAATAKEVALTTGFNFKNTAMIDASVEDNGIVKFDLNAETKAKIANIATNTASIKTNTDRININSIAIKAVDTKKVDKTSVKKIKGDAMIAVDNEEILTKDINLSLKDNSITKAKLAAGVQTSLNKADTALQTLTSTDKSVTITGTGDTKDLSVNIDELTIVRDENGVLKVGAINGSQIILGTITGDRLADHTITEDKLAADLVEQFKQTVKLGNGTNTTVSGTGTAKNPYQVNVVANGKVEKDNTGLISGGMLYDETRVENDGNYIKKGTSAADNLVNLDNAVADNKNAIDANKAAQDAWNKAQEETNKALGADIAANKNEIANIKTDVENKADKDLSNITNDGKDKITGLTEVKAKDGSAITVTATTDEATRKKTYEIDVDEAKLSSSVSIGYKAEGDDKAKSVSASTGFTFAGDDNITAKADADGKITYSLNKELKDLDKITLGKDDKAIAIDGTEGAINIGKEGSINVGDTSITNNEITVGTENKVTISDGHISGIKTEDIVNATDVVNKDYVDTSIGEIGKNVGTAISEVREETSSVAAHNAALAAMKPLAYDPTEKTQIMAGVGRYDNKNAFALGLAVHSNEDLLWNGGISFGNGSKMMVNAGVTWRVGSDARDKMPKIYQNGPITAVYEMSKEFAKIQEENKRLKAQIEQERNTNVELTEKVNKQEEKLNKQEKQIEEIMNMLKK